MKEELEEAAQGTSRAITAIKKSRAEEEEGQRGQANDEDKPKEKEDEKKISPEIAVMQPILRFLQLLCENHNRDLQVSFFFLVYYLFNI